MLDGTPEQQAHYLPRLVSGELIGSFALTEPDSGSDAASLRTTAIRDGDHYVLNGTKRYITNAPEAGIFTVMARTNPGNKSADGISAFIVERNTPGLSLGSPDHKMGHKGSHTCDVMFDDCRVPAANLIGGREGVGFKTAMKVLDKGRINIAAISVGVAERMLADALRYACERKQFGKPIAEFQLVQAMLADSRAELYAARSMVLDAAVAATPARMSVPKRPAPNCLPQKCAAVSPTAPCRFLAVRVIWPNTALSVCTAMCACSAFLKVLRKFSSW